MFDGFASVTNNITRQATCDRDRFPTLAHFPTQAGWLEFDDRFPSLSQSHFPSDANRALLASNLQPLPNVDFPFPLAPQWTMRSAFVQVEKQMGFRVRSLVCRRKQRKLISLLLLFFLSLSMNKKMVTKSETNEITCRGRTLWSLGAEWCLFPLCSQRGLGKVPNTFPINRARKLFVMSRRLQSTATNWLGFSDKF